MNYEANEDAIAEFPVDSEKKFKYVSTHQLECDLDNAVIGLIDPAHVPNVHASWWWRSKKAQKKKPVKKPSVTSAKKARASLKRRARK